MPWLEWFAQKHPALVHLPIAAALLLPLPLLASQRPGRGIRPWWTVSRYLAAFGLLGALLAIPSGLAWGRMLELVPAGKWLVPKGAEGLAASLRLHQLYGLACAGLGALTLFFATRPKRDHESLGLPALLCGLAWAGVALMAGLTGGGMTHPPLPPLEVVAEPAANAAAPTAAEPAPAQAIPPASAEAPLWLLDHARLEPLHGEAVRGAAPAGPHAGRWHRAWATPEAAAAYREGAPLPPGSRLVLSTVEDRWGRPGPEVGPLFALEAGGDGKTHFTFYWPRVPEERRKEADGEARALWQGAHPRLAACQACHAQGLSDRLQRSRWTGPRKPVGAE
jgi:hypothetical protein